VVRGDALATLKLLECVPAEHTRFGDRLDSHELREIGLVSDRVTTGAHAAHIGL